ncbi:MAG: PQQ-binding-like beta-propeller repeat protein [Phycisphaerae bacterium]
MVMTTARKACWGLTALVIWVHWAGSSQAEAADWPTYRGDCHRSGVSAETLRLPLREMWVHRGAHAPRPAWPPPARQDFWHRLHGLSPTMIYDRAYHVAVVGDALYYGSSAADAVYCVDAATGNVLWSYITGGPVRLAPTIDAGKVYLGSDDGCVYCLDAADGRLQWKYRAGPEHRRQPGNGRMISLWPVRSGVLVQGGVACFAAGLFPTQGVYLCAVSAADGREIWKQRIDVSAQGYLLASPTRLFLPTGRSAPRAFERSTGKALGDLGRLGGSFALVLDDMLAHGGSENRQIYIGEPTTQEQIVSVAALRLLAKGPMVYFLKQDTLTALDRTRYLQLSRQIAAIERIEKEKQTAAQKKQLADLKKQRKACRKWEVPCRAPYELIAAGNTLFAGGENQVLAYDAASGEAVWTGAVTGKAYGLAISGGRLFVSTDQGMIHCFGSGLSDGGPAAELPQHPSSPPYPNDEWTPRYVQAADAIVKKSGVEQGYCLVLDAGTGRLAYELAQRTDLRIVGVEEDAEKVAAARRILSTAGLYGTRIAIHHATSDDLPYPSYFANLIVSDETVVTGKPPSTPATHVWRVLRPCGGMVAIGAGDADRLNKWGSDTLRGWRVNRDGDLCWGTVERGPLPGSGEWTHTYAEPGNSASSGDQLVFGEMDLLWFGRPGPRQMIDRHHRNVPPLYKDGRCFIPGDCIVFAVDAYNGTILWQVETPNSRRLGVFLDASNMAVDQECLYLAVGDRCYGLDVETGARRRRYALPQPRENEPHVWGYVAYCEDLLFGSGCKPGAAYTETSRDADNALWYQSMKLVTSDYLFAMNRKTGETLWVYQSGLVINSTITVGGGRMYFVESYTPEALANERGRLPLKTIFGPGEQYLVALDMRTGNVEYKREIDVGRLQEVCYLAYADGILLFSGSKRTDRTVHYHYYAFDARTGEVRWAADHDSGLPSAGGHGEYNRHPTIVGDRVYAWPYAYRLKTGERIEDWKFSRHGHGCGGISASDTSLFWRGWNPWMYDLTPGGGPVRLTAVTRPGCWINIIPAGGLVLIPEASSGCTCPLSLQTSMAFSPGLPAPRTASDSPVIDRSTRGHTP